MTALRNRAGAEEEILSKQASARWHPDQGTSCSWSQPVAQATSSALGISTGRRNESRSSGFAKATALKLYLYATSLPAPVLNPQAKDKILILPSGSSKSNVENGCNYIYHRVQKERNPHKKQRRGRSVWVEA